MKESGLLCQIEWYRDNKNLLPSQEFPEAVFALQKNKKICFGKRTDQNAEVLFMRD